MHLHFTQSLEPLQGAGLGSSALGLHQGFLENNSPSELWSTRERTFSTTWAGVRQFDRKGLGKAFYAPAMAAASREQIPGCSVMHGHGFYVYPNWLLGKLARHHKKPLVYHIQGFLDPWILARSKFKKRLAHLLFENANFEHVSWWRAVSAKEADQARAFGIQAPVEVFPNGVHMPPAADEARLKTLAQTYPKNRPKRLLFLSRIHPKKGLDLLLNAWSQIETALLADWEIAIFGPDENGHQAEIEALAQGHGLDGITKFYGSVSGESKEAAYRSGDLFVLPSRSEGFPMAVLEAASYGLPIVHTNECNFPELTQVGGAWEAQPTVDSLEQSLIEALNASENERLQRGAIARKLVTEHYQWSAIAAEIEATCQQHCFQ